MRVVGRVYVIWEYEQRRGYDREEPLEPFYQSFASAEDAMAKLDKTCPVSEGYREIREHVILG